ncbi:VOC family protein [Atopobacter phocae]|uniref:VOC family protein n=1 Tax=Atopobacter phocae TaxID=136492 RepID=UPI0004723825|nr:VOC family protein [Atopobacter phocae]
MKHTGLHHVSVLGANAKEAYHFYHDILGLQMIMNTVNQDDNSMIHLFFGDESGRSGTEFTVFEMKGAPRNQFGTNAIERTMFLVHDRAALDFWVQRFDQFGVEHYGIETFDGRDVLRFEDSDGQRLGLVYRDEPLVGMEPYNHPDIDSAYLIQGIGDVHLRVRYPEATSDVLTKHFGFEKINEYTMGRNRVERYQYKGNAFKHEVHLIEDKTSPIQRLGVGGAHHLAFGVETRQDLESLVNYLGEHSIINSNVKDREFFKSLYFREPNYNLFEVATPVVHSFGDLPEQHLTYDEQPLFLPEFLESRREEIERLIKE